MLQTDVQMSGRMNSGENSDKGKSPDGSKNLVKSESSSDARPDQAIRAGVTSLRPPAEQLYAEELKAIASLDMGDVPAGWQLSPRAVLLYILGGNANGMTITPKYIGNCRLVETAIATLLTDRALLLTGEPGVAKSWLSENLAAAIYGDSTKVVQGTAGTSEEHIRYTWNYALLLAEGPSDSSLIKSPVMRAMETGSGVRLEEISRCLPEVQDALISILSEKVIVVPELTRDVAAERGFSLIATANTRDRGVNQMSAALKRRFNIVTLPAPEDFQTELAIVNQRVAEFARSYSIRSELPCAELSEKVVTIFRELRSGQTLDGTQKLRSPSTVMSAAEAISLLTNAMSLAASFGDGTIRDTELASVLGLTIEKDDEKNRTIWLEYLESVMKKRDKSWIALYRACRELL